ncbi:MAG: DUF4177 domain-containing protein [Candidatus Poribacteria bacterium]|nr:DUF4177 domain-containing protein [Candidatus Poribacteria bacterium]
MTKYEYKTIRISQKGWGFRSRNIPDLESTLNREGKEGWRLCEVIQPAASMGESTAVIVIFERALKTTED